jgi:hypothetical protein
LKAHRGLVLAALALAAMGCESTQDKSARRKAEGKGLLEEKGLSIARTNAGVRVLGTAVLHDQYGTAAVVELQNQTPRDMADVPIAIDVRGADGKTLYRNNAGGLDKGLVSLPLLPHGKPVIWINNQVVAATAPKEVRVKVGAPKGGTVPATPPQIVLSKVRSDRDTDGPFVSGVIENHSKILQSRLVVYCLARKGGRIVAAGRAVIDKLPPAPTKKPVRFTVYFIGNPTGGRLSFYAPPVELS